MISNLNTYINTSVCVTTILLVTDDPCLTKEKEEIISNPQ